MILHALKMLAAFEEDLAEYYKAMANICEIFPEFWESAAMLKSTRASLYANLIQDFGANTDKYNLEREVNGIFLQIINRVRAQKDRIETDPKILQILRDNDRFIKDIENTSTQKQVLPVVTASTEAFNKIQSILDTTQKRQAAIITAYFKSGKTCIKQRNV